VRFVLVHGGFHGAWCWDRLVPELEDLGHTTVAFDLPGCNDRRSEAATLASWRGSLKEVVEDGDVLVGHSMGGFAITLGADEVPERVARLVYLSASVPVEGGTMGDATGDNVATEWPRTVGLPAEEFMGFVELPGLGPCVRLTDKRAADQLFYHDCTDEDRAWAWERLTPLPLGPSLETFHLPRFWRAPIPRHFVVATDDRSHTVALDNESMGRLGLTTSVGIVSSHSPFVSRPADTARVLDAFARGALD
jgi:pimeloyl-ACP methyl ester carboxylesterase